MPRLLAFVFLLALLTWAPARAVDPAQRQIVYTRKDGEYSWRLKSGNGQTIARRGRGQGLTAPPG